MDKFIKYLEGKKSYFVLLAAAVLNLLQVFDVTHMTPEQLVTLNTFIALLFGVSVKAGINREVGKAKNIH